MHQALSGFRKRHPGVVTDEDRIAHAYSFRPEHVYIGEDEFDGYFAFVFPKASLVLLENPIEGNAAYVFADDWRQLSKLTKTELLQNHRGQFEHVPHKGAWKSRLGRLLKTNTKRRNRPDCVDRRKCSD
jgi:hypothetical protein